jgi:glucose-1-phosphate thymidylyltransferase
VQTSARRTQIALRREQACIFTQRVRDVAASLKPSARGELEITDVNKVYLDDGDLAVEVMGRGMAWLDTGTHESLLEAGQYIATVERRQGLKIACPEEIAYRLGYIDAAGLERLGNAMAKNAYGRYLLGLLREPLVR